MRLSPIVPPIGPRPSRIAIVGEAPGDKEVEAGRPFVGPSGWVLRGMAQAVGLSLHDIFITNVFNRQPPENDIATGYGTTEPSEAARTLGPLTSNPKTWLHDTHLPRLIELYEELEAASPNIIVAMGNTAAWALGLGQGITDLRGNLYTATIRGREYKVLPAYHPAAILRQWPLRTITILDLQRAKSESEFPELRFDNTELWLEPTLADIRDFDYIHMRMATICAADIETSRGQITCISFSPHNAAVSLCIPIWDKGERPNHWTPAEEKEVWAYIRMWMERPDLVKIFQNGLYDLQYLQAHCNPTACTEDTMLAHHSLFSELPKGLGFLGSIFTNTPAWKKMRTFRSEEFKRDE